MLRQVSGVDRVRPPTTNHELNRLFHRDPPSHFFAFAFRTLVVQIIHPLEELFRCHPRSS